MKNFTITSFRDPQTLMQAVIGRDQWSCCGGFDNAAGTGRLEGSTGSGRLVTLLCHEGKSVLEVDCSKNPSSGGFAATVLEEILGQGSRLNDPTNQARGQREAELNARFSVTVDGENARISFMEANAGCWFARIIPV